MKKVYDCTHLPGTDPPLLLIHLQKSNGFKYIRMGDFIFINNVQLGQAGDLGRVSFGEQPPDFRIG
ncbi:hypothetical protein D3C86_2083010 [compost metagenome]